MCSACQNEPDPELADLQGLTCGELLTKCEHQRGALRILNRKIGELTTLAASKDEEIVRLRLQVSPPVVYPNAQELAKQVEVMDRECKIVRRQVEDSARDLFSFSCRLEQLERHVFAACL